MQEQEQEQEQDTIEIYLPTFDGESKMILATEHGHVAILAMQAKDGMGNVRYMNPKGETITENEYNRLCKRK